MAKKTVEDLTRVGAFLVDLGDVMHHLSVAVRDNEEDEIKECMKSLPSQREITKNLVLLGKLLEGQPWKKGKRHG